jgi:hypothetical protein
LGYGRLDSKPSSYSIPGQNRKELTQVTGYRAEQISKDISVYRLQDKEETEQVKEQDGAHIGFSLKKRTRLTGHRLQNRKVVIQVIGYRLPKRTMS